MTADLTVLPCFRYVEADQYWYVIPARKDPAKWQFFQVNLAPTRPVVCWNSSFYPFFVKHIAPFFFTQTNKLPKWEAGAADSQSSAPAAPTGSSPQEIFRSKDLKTWEAAPGMGGVRSYSRDCHFADALSPSLLKHLLQAEGGAAEGQSRRRLGVSAVGAPLLGPPTPATLAVGENCHFAAPPLFLQ